MKSPWNYRKATEKAAELQFIERRYRPVSMGIAELMQLAVRASFSERIVPIGLCRLLFRPNPPVTWREPLLGMSGLIGNTTHEQWTAPPFHEHFGVLFDIVPGYTVAGLPEPPASYLAWCILNTEWNDSDIQPPTQDHLVESVEDFIVNGPWQRPLRESEKEFLRIQVE